MLIKTKLFHRLVVALLIAAANLLSEVSSQNTTCDCDFTAYNKGVGCLNRYWNATTANSICGSKAIDQALGFGDCVPSNGCPLSRGYGGPARPYNATVDDGNYTQVAFMEPVPRETYIYECQNTSLFLAVFNMSLTGYNHLYQAVNIYVNTVTCVTVVPGDNSFAGIFNVDMYNSCDYAGGCSRCNDCNCTCRVVEPWYWDCCRDPCFGCRHCCDCRTDLNWGYNWFDTGSCLQCNTDGWCVPNGQMLTPTVCQFALIADNPGNALDYEELVSSNFSYQVRILQRTLGCDACNAQAMVNLTVYVKDCNEWPIFDTNIYQTEIYQYEGLTHEFYGSCLEIIVRDPDIYNIPFSTIDLNIVRVQLFFGGGVSWKDVNPIPWYITNTHFIGNNANNANASTLAFDASRCGSQLENCLDLFRYSYSGAAPPNPPRFRIYITATDGGGLVRTHTVTVTILNTPAKPQWVNMPATVSFVEHQTGNIQLYPMTAIVPGTGGTIGWHLINVDPMVDFTVNPYFTVNSAVPSCTPAAPSAVKCNGLRLHTSVVANTFWYSKQNRYNITVQLTNTVGSNSYTITSSVIVNVLQLIYQPNLTVSNYTTYVREDIKGSGCFYNITEWFHQNNHTYFLYTIQYPLTTTGGVTVVHNGIFMNGSAICYDTKRDSKGSGSASGWLFDARGTNLYVIKIKVADPYSTLTAPIFQFNLYIVDVENPPVLHVPVFQNIPETATSWSLGINCTKETGMPAVTFALIDQDVASNNTMWYISSQSSSNALADALANIQANPTIVPTPMFSFMRTPFIQLKVICYSPTYTVTEKITFFILRVNTAPVFVNLPARWELAEEIMYYVPFFTITTTDREGDPTRVFFCNPSTGTLNSYEPPFPNQRFYLDPDRKVIQTHIPDVAHKFDFYSTPMYNLTICAIDTPASMYTPKTSSSTILIYILLNQTAPTLSAPPHNGGATVSPNILENVKGQKYIFTLGATDREGDTPLCYNLTEVRPYKNAAFNIPPCSNLLEYNQDLAVETPMFNYRKNPVYYIVVDVSDRKTTPTSTGTITVSLVYVPLPAVWTSLPAVVTVREDVYWGPTELLVIGAMDPNGLYNVTINLAYISPVNGTSQFYFNSTTNSFGYNFNPKFAYGVFPSYKCVFTASNGILPTITSSVVVQILKVPTAPEMQKIGNVSIYENVTAGQTLWDMKARDNTSLTLKYGILDVDPSTGFQKFTVSSNGIIRSVNNPNFNYQACKLYVLRATAANSAGLVTTFTLSIHILNCAGMPTITNLPAFTSIKEGSKGSILGGLYSTNCIDRDNLPLYWSYSVLPNTGYSYFNITSAGVVQITQYSEFSYLDQPYYYVKVFCTNGYYTATGTLTVVVLWTTSTTSTTPAPRTTIPDEITTTTVIPEGDLLTPEQIGAIVGSLLGALVLAGASWGIARYLQHKARKEGLTRNMKKPAMKQFTSTKI